MSVRKRTYLQTSTGQHITCWVIDVVVRHADGRVDRVRKTSPVQTRRAAESYERELRKNILLGKTSNGETPGQTAPESFEDFSEEFLNVYAVANNKPSEVSAKRSTLTKHLIPFFKDRNLRDICSRDFEVYKIKKTSEGLSPKTINNHLATAARALRIARDWGYLDKIVKPALMKVPPQGFQFLSINEAERLIHAAHGKWKLMIRLALKTGLRQGELRALKWSDIHFSSGVIVVSRAAWQSEVGSPKSGRAREVGLSRTMLDMLRQEQLITTSKFLFCDSDSKMLSKGACKWPLWRASDRAGLDKRLGWHVLRHTFASHLVELGVSLKVVQELLGHADIKMTLRYTHLTPRKKNEAVELLER